MVAMPGTPQIQNIIPAAYFETSSWSGIGIGLFATIIFMVMGWGWLTYRMKKLKEAGEGYGAHAEDRADKGQDVAERDRLIHADKGKDQSGDHDIGDQKRADIGARKEHAPVQENADKCQNRR
jgi:hypothetical protein